MGADILKIRPNKIMVLMGTLPDSTPNCWYAYQIYPLKTNRYFFKKSLSTNIGSPTIIWGLRSGVSGGLFLDLCGTSTTKSMHTIVILSLCHQPLVLHSPTLVWCHPTNNSTPEKPFVRLSRFFLSHHLNITNNSAAIFNLTKTKTEQHWEWW